MSTISIAETEVHTAGEWCLSPLVTKMKAELSAALNLLKDFFLNKEKKCSGTENAIICM